MYKLSKNLAFILLLFSAFGINAQGLNFTSSDDAIINRTSYNVLEWNTVDTLI